MIKKYRSGKEIEQQATFDNDTEVNGSKIISMVPHWDTYTPELSYWQNELPNWNEYQPMGIPVEPNLQFEDLLP
jgi:hypothetical protein